MTSPVLMTDAQAKVWEQFCGETGHAGSPHDVYAFGDNPSLANELLTLILSGEKRATASRRAIYASGEFVPPAAGARSLVLDGAETAVCVIETISIEDVPFDDVTAEFAAIEGEGDKTLAWWRDAHLAYFQRETAREGTAFDHREAIVCEVFDCIWRAER